MEKNDGFDMRFNAYEDLMAQLTPPFAAGASEN